MKISMALDKFDEHQLFVPAFQREYVWKRDDAKQLIDSLIKEYPTGTMLTWDTNSPPELKGPHKYDEAQGTVKILLDGQQRLTTLYMLIRGQIPPYYSAPEILKDTRGLYVNVETLELEYYSKTKMANDPCWQNITDIFQKKVRAKHIVQKLRKKGEEVNLQRDDSIDDNFDLIQKIVDRDFPEHTVPVYATIRDAIDIFYKVNASGVSLTDAELALAQISGYWPKAREKFKQKLFDLQNKGYVFKLDFLVYVLLGCMYHLGSDMKKLHDPDNNDQVRRTWQLLDGRILDYVVEIMKSHAYVDHTYEINSVYALVPIIVYCFDKNGGSLNDIEIRKLVKWFYYSQIRARYISQLPQKLDRDLRIVKESKNPFDDLLAVIEEERRLEISPEEFVGRSTSHPLFGLVRWYFKSKQAFCLTTGIKLQQAMGKIFTLENDHIFPFSKLKQQGYNRENRLKYSLAQELTNRAILTQIANRTKGTLSAKDYLSDVNTKFPNGLSLQCIPEDPTLWEIENYEKFLQVRREIFATELNDFLTNITESKSLGVPITLEELIAGGEGEELELKSSLRWDYVRGELNKNLENVMLKTVASFANGQGGTLLIGVRDDGKVLGLEHDYHSLGDADRDKLELHIRNLLDKTFGTAFVTMNISISFPQIGDDEICRFDVQRALEPIIVSLKDKNGQSFEKFFVRSGNSSKDLSLSEMHSYCEERFSA